MATIFTYGTLKRGFWNHTLMHDLISSGEASFLRPCLTAVSYPLVCGPYRVPFLLNLPGCGPHRVAGELYRVSLAALDRLDVLEGTSRGHYERLPIVIINDHDDHDTNAQAYFAHSSYALDMWNKLGSTAVPSYSHDVARGYVKRAERPSGLTFLDHIHSFLLAQPPSPPITAPCRV